MKFNQTRYPDSAELTVGFADRVECGGDLSAGCTNVRFQEDGMVIDGSTEIDRDHSRRDLVEIATRGLGHVLGLDHSDHPQRIMESHQ